ncbi:MAG: hypothetical protein IKV54_05780 [Clostridia bacterium]|nr:hypothetical protein [Clostridia bacterium]
MNKETVAALAERLGLEKINLADPDREVTAGYVGDLLSWVMGRAPEGGAWVTVMTNVNVIAVASLSDVACVILAEGAELDEAALSRAETEGINVLASKLPAFDIVRAL